MPERGSVRKGQATTRSLLAVLGQDPYREGLRHTPERMARMYAELLAGYDVNVEALVKDARVRSNIMRGIFQDDAALRREFVQQLQRGSVL